MWSKINVENVAGTSSLVLNTPYTTAAGGQGSATTRFKRSDDGSATRGVLVYKPGS